MYIPKYFENHDKDAVLDFIQQHNFATLISVDKNQSPTATHLPFLIENTQEKLRFYSHMSAHNPHQHLFKQDKHLIIFQAPHAYISPTLYDKKQNVPTWNYVAVHCYGKINKLAPAQHLWLLEKSIDYFEKEYKFQWSQLDEKYKSNLMKGIIAFEFVVEEIQAKEKLSQNKTKAEQERIAETLASSAEYPAQETAKYMHQNLEKQNPNLP